MYLNKEQIAELCKSSDLLSNYNDANCNDVAYDLTVDYIFQPGSDVKNQTSFELAPGETAFFAAKEELKLPDNLLGFIIERNGAVRQGLTIAAPVYRPGHHTVIYIRVTNDSKSNITIKSGNSIASIMFYKLDNNVPDPYKGTFANEFKYSGAGNFHSVPLPEQGELEKKIDSVKDIEHNMYSNVLVLMTIFVGMFSILNINIGFIKVGMQFSELLMYNLVCIGTISALVALVALLTEKKVSVAGWSAGLSALSIFATKLTMPC